MANKSAYEAYKRYKKDKKKNDSSWESLNKKNNQKTQQRNQKAKGTGGNAGSSSNGTKNYTQGTWGTAQNKINRQTQAHNQRVRQPMKNFTQTHSGRDPRNRTEVTNHRGTSQAFNRGLNNRGNSTKDQVKQTFRDNVLERKNRIGAGGLNDAQARLDNKMSSIKDLNENHRTKINENINKARDARLKGESAVAGKVGAQTIGEPKEDSLRAKHRKNITASVKDYSASKDLAYQAAAKNYLKNTGKDKTYEDVDREALEEYGGQFDKLRVNATDVNRIDEQIEKDFERMNEAHEVQQEIKDSASNGLSRFLWDAESEGAKMLLDQTTGLGNPTATFGGMGSRAFGASYKQAKDAGATDAEATRFAVANAGKEIATEKMFGLGGKGMKGYGGGVGDDIVERALSKVANNATNKLENKALKNLTHAGLNHLAPVLTEAIEEGAADVVEPGLANALYANAVAERTGDDSVRQHFSAKDMLYDMALGGFLGGMSGTSASVQNYNRGKEVTEIYGDEGLKKLADQVSNVDEDMDAGEQAKAIAQMVKEGKTVAYGQYNELYNAAQAQAQRNQETFRQADRAAADEMRDRGLADPFERTVDMQTGTMSLVGKTKFVQEQLDNDLQTANEAVNQVIKKNESDLGENYQIDDNNRANIAEAIAHIKSGNIMDQSDVETIVSDPVARTAYERIAGEELPASNKEARKHLFQKAAANKTALAEAERENIYDTAKGLETQSEKFGPETIQVVHEIMDTIDENTPANEIRNKIKTVNAYIDAAKAGVDLQSMDEMGNPAYETVEPELRQRLHEASVRENGTAALLNGEVVKQGESIAETVKRVQNSGKKVTGVFSTRNLPDARKTEIKQSEKRALDEMARVFNLNIEAVSAEWILQNKGLVGDKVRENAEKLRAEGRDPLLAVPNGIYDPKTGTIYWNIDSKKPFGFIIGHETLHHVRVYAPEEYKRMKDLFVSRKITADREGFESRLSSIEETYSEAGKNLSRDTIIEEMMADQMYELIQSPSFWEKVEHEEPSLAKALIDAIRDVMNKIREVLSHGERYAVKEVRALYDELGILSEMEDLAIAAYKKASENKLAVGEARVKSGTRLNVTSAQDQAYLDAVERGDMETAQRMVDDAAEKNMPDTKLKGKWYHGTNDDFNVFDFSQGGKNGRAEGFGIYLAKNPEISKTYGDRLIEGYVSMKRPANSNKRTMSKTELKKLIRLTVDRQAEEMAKEDYDGDVDSARKDTWISDYTYTYDKSMDASINEVAESIMSMSDNDMAIIQEIMFALGIRDYNRATEFYEMLTSETGFDGFTTEWENSEGEKNLIALAFKSNQIKSADPVTYDDAGNVIPLSERFNTENPDIRYSMPEGNAQTMAGLSSDRIDSLIEEYATDSETSDYAQAYIATIDPRDYLKLTISDDALKEWTPGSTNAWGQEVRDLDAEELRKSDRIPYLRISSMGEDGNRVLGHEGRHRMLALLRAGYTDVPVVVIDNDTKNSKVREDSIDLWSQDHGDGPVNGDISIDVYDAIPIRKNMRDEIDNMYGVTEGVNDQVQFSITVDSEGNNLTPAQQEYFADSKVRDEQGRLIPMYHYTDADIERFDRELRGSATGYDNTALGTFVTSNEKFAKRFGKNKNKMYALVKNPITFPWDAHKKYSPEECDEIVEKWERACGNEELLGHLREYALDESETDVIAPGDIYDMWMEVMALEDLDFDFYAEQLKGTEYDGVEFIEGTEDELVDGSDSEEVVTSYAIPNSNQLKDVTNEEPTESEDIRFSVDQPDLMGVDAEDGIREINGDADRVRFNLASADKVRESLEKYWNERINAESNSRKRKQLEKDYETAMAQYDSMRNLAENMAQDEANYKNFAGWQIVVPKTNRAGKPVGSVIVTNGEYAMNIDFSTICKKRRALDNLLFMLSKEGIFDSDKLEGTTIVSLNEALAEHGYEVSCPLCFVDTKRYGIYNWADSFTTYWNGVVNLLTKDTGVETSDFNFLNRSDVYDVENGADKVSDDKLNMDVLDRIINYNGKISEPEFQVFKDDKGNMKGIVKDIAEAIKGNPDLRKKMTAADILASPGQEAVRQYDQRLFTILNGHMGSAKPKNSYTDTPATGEILASSWTPEKAFEVGGVSIQSFSDYIGYMFFDYVQTVAELSAKGLPVHGYTKEADFVRIFGKTGIKINMSLVPKVDIEPGERERYQSYLTDKGELRKDVEKDPEKKADYDYLKAKFDRAGLDENGDYLWADESFGPNGGQEGFDLAVELLNHDDYHRNVGTIAVGVSDAHIRKLLSDPRISMVIPYHASGINKKVAIKNDIDFFVDYTNSQNDTIGSEEHAKKLKKRAQKMVKEGKLTQSAFKKLSFKAGNSMSRIYKAGIEEQFDFYASMRKNGYDAKKTAQEYLADCDKKGIAPVFSKFRDEDGYYKMIIDFNSYDRDGKLSPQKAVKNEYPDNVSEYIMESVKMSEEDASRLDVDSDEFQSVLDDARKIASGTKFSVDAKPFSISANEMNANLHEVHRMNPVGPVEFSTDLKVTDETGENAKTAYNYLEEKDALSFQRNDLGEIGVSISGLADVLNHGNYRFKMSIMGIIPEVIRHGKVVAADINHKNRGYNTVTLVAKVTFTGKGNGKYDVPGDYYAAVVLKRKHEESGRIGQLLHVTDVLIEKKDSRSKVLSTPKSTLSNAENLYLRDILRHVAADVNIFEESDVQLKYSVNPIESTIASEDDAADYIEEHEDEFPDSVPLGDFKGMEGRQRMLDTIADLRQQVEVLKEDKKLTHGKVLDKKSVKPHFNEMVRTLLSEGKKSSKTKNDAVNSIVANASTVYRALKNNDPDEAAEVAYYTARELVETLVVRNDELYEETRDLREELRNTRIVVPEEVKKDIPDYNDFRKSQMGRLRLVNEGGAQIDTLYEELCEQYPQFFDSEITHPSDQLQAIADKLDEFRPYDEMLTSEEAETLTGQIASDILNITYDNGEAHMSWADRKKQFYDDKLKAMKVRHQEALRAARTAERIASEREKREYKRKQKQKDEQRKSRAERKKAWNKINEDYKWLTERILNPTEKKPMPEKLRKPLAEILCTIDLQSERSKQIEAKTGVKAQRTLKMDSLQKALAGLAKEDGSFAAIHDEEIESLMEEFTNKTYGMSVDELTNEEIEDVAKILRAIRHEVSNINKAFKLSKDMSEMGEQVIGEAKTHSEKHPLKRDGGLVRELMGDGMTTPRDFFEKLGPGMFEAFMALRNGDNTHMDHMEEARKFFTGMFKKYHKKGKPGSSIKKWRNTKNKKDFKLENGDTISLTPAQVMSLYCAAKRDQALGHILGCGIVASDVTVKNNWNYLFGTKQKNMVKSRPVNLTHDDVVEICKSLTDEQRGIADKMQEYLVTTCAEWGNETSMEMYGFKKFVDPDYFPIKSEAAFLDSNFEKKQRGGMVESIRSFGFTKGTVVNANNAIVIDDIFSVVTKHVSDMSLYNSFASAIADFTRLYNYRTLEENEDGSLKADSVKAALQEAFGTNVDTYINNFMADVQNQNRTRKDPITGIADFLLSNYKKAAIGANLRVAAQQPTAIVRALNEISPKYFVKMGHKPFFADKKDERAFAEMVKWCPVARRKSWGFSQTDLAKPMEDIIMNEQWSRLDVFTMMAYGALDNWTWTKIWKAVKAETKDKHPEVEYESDEFFRLCSERATEVFDKTQVVDSVFHRSDVMRSKNQIAKVATAFMAEPTRTYNMLKSDIIKANELWHEGDKLGAMKKLNRTLTVFAANALACALAQTLIDALRGKGGDDDDDDDEGNKYLKLLLDNWGGNMNPMGMVPILKDFGSYRQGYGAQNMVWDGLSDLVKDCNDIYKYMRGEDTKKSIYEMLFKLAQDQSYVTGVPLKNFLRDAKAVMDYFSINPFAATIGGEESEDGAGSEGNVIQQWLSEKTGFGKSKESGNSSRGEGDGEGQKEEIDYGIYKDEDTGKSSGWNRLIRKVSGGKYGQSEQDYLAQKEKEDYQKRIDDLKALGDPDKIYSKATKNYTKILEQGDFETIDEMKQTLIDAGGDIDKFNKQLETKMKSNFKKGIGGDDEYTMIMMKSRLMEDYGWDEATISRELIEKTDVAKEFQKAAAADDTEKAQMYADQLARAGITQEDLDYLYRKRWSKVDAKTTGQFSWPVQGRLSSGFGHRWGTLHAGIDIAVPVGTSVEVADGGTVMHTGRDGSRGIYVDVKHDNGYITRYQHLSSYSVQQGQKVAKGEIIAKSGNTGHSTGPHLHFSVYRGGTRHADAIDPMKFLGKN